MLRTATLAMCMLLMLGSTIAAQDQPSLHADAFWYGQFGYGTIATPTFGGPSLGFGRRIERDRFGVDVLLFTGQAKIFGTAPDLHEVGGLYTHAYAVSVGTIRGMYVLFPGARTSPYVAGGAGWGAHDFGHTVAVDEQWHGKGLQGIVSLGYSFARSQASTRFFFQADWVRPFYMSTRHSHRAVVPGERRATSLVVSLGAGW